MFPATSSHAASLGTITDAYSAAGVSLAANQIRSWRLDAPVGQKGYRITAPASAAVRLELWDIYSDPANPRRILSSSSSTQPTLLVDPTLIHDGYSYRLDLTAIYNSSAVADLYVTPEYARSVVWDDGTVENGTQLALPADSYGGDYLFKVVAQPGIHGGWRSRLNVLQGEADMYMQATNAPTGNGSYYSTRVGPDAITLDNSQFTPNSVWYIRVHATPGAQWNLVSGDLFVHDLGTVGTTAAAGGQVTVGPEGMATFRVSIDSYTEAWRLWLNGDPYALYVRQGKAVIANASNTFFDRSEYGTSDYGSGRLAHGQMLVVPPYLSNAVYYIGVAAAPGTVINLDSRKQQVRIPNAEPSYVAGASGKANFDFTLTGTDDAGFGYVTYRIDVPLQQIAWQTNLSPTSGNANLYVRKGAVPNLWNNDGFSEAPAGVTDSITHVPPTLTNGVWYVTVHGIGAYSFTLTSNNPVITPAAVINDPAAVGNPYASTSPLSNGTAFQNQSGWRYYQVTDVNAFLSQLGWQLALSNATPGTQLAIRRNAVPSSWNYRSNGSTYDNSSSHIDYSSASGLLQLPSLPADIWYIGVYSPGQALGTFNLTTSAIPSPQIGFNGGSVSVVDQYASTWKFFKVTVPVDAYGWDLR
ncbi:MAG: hypothetical protein D6682_01960, partial [Zetaproteobacteria bacterium]